MPLNLSALVRYRTLNNCFSSIRKFTIDELVERCSEAISDYKGYPCTVSERTVREDIKNMRSDLLGFRAPIVQNEGYYFYSDKDYDLLNHLVSGQKLVLELIDYLERKTREKADYTALTLLTKLRGLALDKYELEVPDWEKVDECNESIPHYMELNTFGSRIDSKAKKALFTSKKQKTGFKFSLRGKPADREAEPKPAWNAFGRILQVLEGLNH